MDGRNPRSYLSKLDKSPDVAPEFFSYEQHLVKEKLKTVEAEIQSLNDSYPQLQLLTMEQLRETLLDIEADFCGLQDDVTRGLSAS